MILTIAVAQIAGNKRPNAKNIHTNGRHIRDRMHQAHAAGVRLIQFHEGALSSYPSKYLMSSLGPKKIAEADWANVAWDVLAAELRLIMDLARELKLWVVVGSIHKLPLPHRPYNSLYVISDEGKIVARYDKRLLSHTEITYMYTPGQKPVTFEVDGFTFGCIICIEINYPELFMQYEQLGVDCVLFSTYSEDTMFGIEAQGHAASNSYWITFSPPTQGATAVAAGVIAPNGTWLRQAKNNRQQIVVATLDASLPEAEVAIKYRRPWRKIARDGKVYSDRFV